MLLPNRFQETQLLAVEYKVLSRFSEICLLLKKRGTIKAPEHGTSIDAHHFRWQKFR